MGSGEEEEKEKKRDTGTRVRNGNRRTWTLDVVGTRVIMEERKKIKQSFS